MNAQTILEELEALADKLHVHVAYNRFSNEGAAGGGICRVKGEWRAIIERGSSTSEKASTLARCLSQFDVENHFLSPAARQLIDRNKADKSV